MHSAEDIKTYLTQHLQTRFMGRGLHYLETTTSTMDVAKELALQGAAEGTAVIAGSQQAGRGRLGRSWFSPEGSLAMSIVVRPDLALARLLPAVASLAVFHALKKIGISADIKWPNDVLIKGKKVCGILIESRMEADRMLFAIIGIGINVDFDIKRYEDIAEIATSVSEQLGRRASVAEVALALLDELEKQYEKSNDRGRVLREWKDKMETIGQIVRVSMGGRIEEGVAESIDDDGNLRLRRPDNSLLTVVAGDVTLLKG